MYRIDSDTVADLFFRMQWSSDIVRHTEAYAAAEVNFWRDLLPDMVKETLLGKRSGDQVQFNLTPEELIQTTDNGKLLTIRASQFDGPRISPAYRSPQVGRFYPKGILKDVTNVFKANREPFSLVKADNSHMTIDMGHPLTGRPLEFSITVGEVGPKITERGGSVRDWGDIITQGVGMQARWKKIPSDFFSNSPFAREDDGPDDLFYAKPRLVQHIDDAAHDMVQLIYSRFTSDGMRVLDLMSGYQSHLPADTKLSNCTGIGLNPVEMELNHQLTDYLSFDINQAAGHLPLESNSFDAAVCTVSVEYLTEPLQVFGEVARILRPGGWFVVTFSNRWFAPKTIRIWPELHEFERMGLVLEYFRLSECYSDLGTYSIRGLQRPAGDKYYGRIPFSDPIYAVWGRTQ